MELAVACLISYELMTFALAQATDRANDYLGGMWATVATVFVFRDTQDGSLSVGVDRLVATCVSFLLCFLYLSFFPFTPLGMAILIGVGTLIMTMLGRRDDIVTTGITTSVVMVVAAMDARHAWLQPWLRFLDTLVGIAIGVGVKWIGSYLFHRFAGRPQNDADSNHAIG